MFLILSLYNIMGPGPLLSDQDNSVGDILLLYGNNSVEANGLAHVLNSYCYYKE